MSFTKFYSTNVLRWICGIFVGRRHFQSRLFRAKEGGRGCGWGWFTSREVSCTKTACKSHGWHHYHNTTGVISIEPLKSCATPCRFNNSRSGGASAANDVEDFMSIRVMEIRVVSCSASAQLCSLGRLLKTRPTLEIRSYTICNIILGMSHIHLPPQCARICRTLPIRWSASIITWKFLARFNQHVWRLWKEWLGTFSF